MGVEQKRELYHSLVFIRFQAALWLGKRQPENGYLHDNGVGLFCCAALSATRLAHHLSALSARIL